MGKTRKAKKEWMLKTIHSFFKNKPNDKIDVYSLLNQFALTNDSTIRTGKEILLMLNSTGKIKIIDGEIVK